MIQSAPNAISYVSPGSLRRFAQFSASLQPSTKIWIEHQARMEAMQPVQSIPFMRATIRRRFPKLSSATIEALLAVMIQQLLQPTNQSDSSQASQTGVQMHMSSYSQLQVALSNLMKSFDDTQASITKNMK